MIPTMYLRQIEINIYCNGEYLMLENKPTNKTEVTGYRLQQWWAKAAFMSGPETGEGEWRDVEIVDDV
jgi:hypothetical protein